MPLTTGGDTSTTPSAGGPGDGGLGLQLSEEELKRLTEAVVGVIRSSGTVPVPVPSAAESCSLIACTRFMHWHLSLAQDLKGGPEWDSCHSMLVMRYSCGTKNVWVVLLRRAQRMKKNV